MKAADVLATVLVIVGALNWLLVGAFNFNLVTALLGPTVFSTFVFILVGVAGIYFLVRWATGANHINVGHASAH